MELYAKVFVHAPSYDDVVRHVERIVGGTARLRTVEGSALLVDVLPNDEHDEVRAAGGAGDFLYFPYVLDVEPGADGDDDVDRFVPAVAALLDGLGAAGFDYVTASDLEDALPGAGRSPRPTT